MKLKINITKREAKIIAIAIIAGLFLGWLFFHGTVKSGSEASKEINSHKHEEEKGTVWTCSMHPQIRMDKPGKCPICAMDLIPIEGSGGDEQAVSPDEIQMTEAAMKIAEADRKRDKAGRAEAEAERRAAEAERRVEIADERQMGN